MTVIGHDMSGHATVIAFKVRHNLKKKKKSKKSYGIKTIRPLVCAS